MAAKLCEDCDKTFSSARALQQHIRDSPAHAVTYDCDECNRTFGSEQALHDHIRDSPAHAVTYDCDECNRAFGSETALQDHLRDAPAHAVTYDCDECNRTFGSEQALHDHIRDSPVHSLPLTPLDRFFSSFPDFAYQRTLSPAKSYQLLRQHHGWQKGDDEAEEAWDDYQEALRAEIKLWYGSEDNLEAWHTLCHAIGISPPPDTIRKCEMAVRNTHVNIVDLIELGRSGSMADTKVRVFGSLDELREYSRSTGRIFRNTLQAHTSESNVVLRHLLRNIYRGSL